LRAIHADFLRQKRDVLLLQGSQEDYTEDTWRVKGYTRAQWCAAGCLLSENGSPSRLTENQYRTVRTARFRAWFGDWLHRHNPLDPFLYHVSSARHLDAINLHGLRGEEGLTLVEPSGIHPWMDRVLRQNQRAGYDLRSEFPVVFRVARNLLSELRVNAAQSVLVQGKAWVFEGALSSDLIEAWTGRQWLHFAEPTSFLAAGSVAPAAGSPADAAFDRRSSVALDSASGEPAIFYGGNELPPCPVLLTCPLPGIERTYFVRSKSPREAPIEQGGDGSFEDDSKFSHDMVSDGYDALISIDPLGVDAVKLVSPSYAKSAEFNLGAFSLHCLQPEDRPLGVAADDWRALAASTGSSDSGRF
jgi:hypothetical protein